MVKMANLAQYTEGPSNKETASPIFGTNVRELVAALQASITPRPQVALAAAFSNHKHGGAYVGH